MKKKIISIILLAAISVNFVFANYTLMEQTGIIDSDTNLSAYVSRGQFCEMLVNASSYKDTVGYGVSLFSDVKSDNEYSPYIEIATDNGWATAYIDGTFKPSQAITAGEAYIMVLKLMGYDLTGLSYQKVISLADEVGIKVTNTSSLTFDDCVEIFTNALNGKTSSGSYYATTIGYSMIDDEVDVLSVIENNLSTASVYSGNSSVFTGKTIYVNNELATVSDIHINDIYYISDNNAFVYSDRVYGIIDSINDNVVSPTSVTVNGVAYSLSSTAKYKLSVSGSIKKGEMVTLLLGFNDTVVDIVENIGETNYYYGVITSNTSTITGSTIEIYCTDGVTRQFGVDYTDADGIAMVKISDTITLTELKTLDMDISYDMLASDVQIIDVADTNAKVIYRSELAGIEIDEDDVLYYTYNSSGYIDNLILDNATGYLITYAYLEDVTETNSNLSLSGTYEMYIDGKLTTLRTSGYLYNISEGGIALFYEDGSVSKMSSIDKVTINSITGYVADTTDGDIIISSDVQILLVQDGDYVEVELSDITDGYKLTAYYDDSVIFERIQIIIAR